MRCRFGQALHSSYLSPPRPTRQWQPSLPVGRRVTWTRLSDDFYDDPQLARVSRSARLLYVEALAYCNRHLTDGRLPTAMLRRICDADDPHELAAELVVVGKFASLGTEGWQVDWSEQESAERVQARRQQNAERQAAWRRRHASRDALRDRPRDSVAGALVAMPRPDPSQDGVGRAGGVTGPDRFGQTCNCARPAPVVDGECVVCGGVR